VNNIQWHTFSSEFKRVVTHFVLVCHISFVTIKTVGILWFVVTVKGFYDLSAVFFELDDWDDVMTLFFDVIEKP
jgi:hypothetical protein